jgi:hypothetical protein
VSGKFYVFFLLDVNDSIFSYETRKIAYQEKGNDTMKAVALSST